MIPKFPFCVTRPALLLNTIQVIMSTMLTPSCFYSSSDETKQTLVTEGLCDVILKRF